MNEYLLSNPFFGLTLSLVSYYIGMKINKKTGISFLQPILISGIICISFLYLTGITFDQYKEQNQILTFMLPITAVVLAVPLYNNIHLLAVYGKAIILGILAGTVTTILTVIAMAKLLGADLSIILTLIPKSVTNPIAIEVSEIIGGIPSLTVALVVITGTFGGVFGPEILNFMRIKHPVARGVATGTITHVVGTARAFKEGEIQGAISSLSMAIAGIVTAVLAPLFVVFLG